MRIWVRLLAALAPLVPLTGLAEVRVIAGPTPIPAGNARAAGDLTVVNEHLAFALAVQTPPPYGVPRGAIIDVAPVSAGVIGRDRVVFADFIPNNWSAWPNTYQHVEVLERGPREARIRAVRDFGRVRIETLYTLAAGADAVTIVSTMTNEGDAALPDLLSGLTLWPSSGFLFPVPGLAGLSEGRADAALAPRVSAYDRDWTVTLHAPYLEQIGSGSRDLFARHTLAAHQSRSFSGSLQVGARGDLAPVLEAEIARQGLGAGRVHGSVRDYAGAALALPVVVVEKAGKPYAWTLGESGAYQLALAPGSYVLYATGPGYARSAPREIRVSAGTEATCDFGGLEPPGTLALAVREHGSHRPLDARIVIAAGEKPVVEFLGRRTFFTELAARGQAHLTLAPGPYTLAVSAGGGVLAPEVQVPVSVASARRSERTVEVAAQFAPARRGWYAADLHHHADQAEAVTPPEELARSQLAAGLDVLFVSDHDSTANHAALARIAAARGVAFIPGIELSPSWGHFNAYPLTPGAQLAIDTGTASVQQVFAEARRLGASVIQVNHPFIPFGYFSSVAAGVAPGGFDDGFDLMEINSSAAADDERVLRQLWDYWNRGRRHYLAAGSDTHDVWNEQSARVRTYAHLDGAPGAQAYAAALTAGHAYVTYGPLLFPTPLFGSEVPLRPGTALTLDFDLAAVAGLKQLLLIGGGEVRAQRSFPGAPRTAHVRFTLPDPAPWYAVTLEDAAGHRAYSDPVWVSAAPAGAH